PPRATVTAPASQDARRPPDAREVAPRTSAAPPASASSTLATLGAGIMLLGLGLAFFALRLRRR
ncbi:hypothetical protein L1885_22615, partial [Streptomyces fuscigenes]|nr:hypothetical protein [Streptomyces fuscigenes]